MVIFSHVPIDLIQVCYESKRKATEKKNQPENKFACFFMTLGVLQKKKWENAMTIDKRSWGYRADARLDDFMTNEQLIKGKCVSVCGY